MRIRFTGTVGLRTGPQYNLGEEADLPEPLANEIVANGFAQRVPPVEPPHPPRQQESEKDRMLRREDGKRKTAREG